MPLEPLAPFDTWPRQVSDEEAGLLVWFLPPEVVVFQHTHEVVDAVEAGAVVRLLDAVFDAEPRQYRASGGLLMVHDLRCVKGMTFAAQRLLRDTWAKRQRGDARGVVLLGLKTSFFMMRVVHTIAAAAKAFTDIEFDVIDFDEGVQKHRLVAPGMGVEFPRPRAA